MIEPNRDGDQICDWLLEQDPELVLHWFYEVWEGLRQVPEGLNWLYLAETFPNLAHKNENVIWARIGVLVNTYLIYEAKVHGRVFWSTRMLQPDARERACDTPQRRVLGLRVRFLIKHGHVPGDPVLDSNLLVQSFFDGLTLSPEEALKQCAAGRKELSREQRWTVERLRRNLEYLRPLAERHLLPANQELLAWYAIRERLSFS